MLNKIKPPTSNHDGRIRTGKQVSMKIIWFFVLRAKIAYSPALRKQYCMSGNAPPFIQPKPLFIHFTHRVLVQGVYFST